MSPPSNVRTWMPWYPADFISSSTVARMSLEEQGAYRRLLDFQWMDGSIPSDAAEIAGMLGVGRAKAAALWKRIGGKFTPSPDRPGYLRNERLHEHWMKSEALHAERSDTGKRGAASRWSKAKPKAEPLAEPVAEPMAEPMANRWPSPSPSPSPLPTANNPPGEQPPGPAVSKPKRAPSGPAQELLAWFPEAYQLARGTPYRVSRKDAVQVTEALKLLPAGEVRARLERGLQTTDDFIAKTDRNLALLCGNLNRPSLRGIDPGRDVRVGRADAAPHEAFKETRRVDL